MARRRKKNDGPGGPIAIGIGVVGLAWYYHPFFGVLALGLVLWLTYYLVTTQRRADRKRLELLKGQERLIEATRHMSGTEFERVMALFFEQAGYSAKITGGSGDQGMDLLLSKGGRTVAVQLKRYTRPVGNSAVQQALSGKTYYGTEEAWVLTTSSFTKKAHELAARTGVRLIDGVELARWLSGDRPEYGAAPVASQEIKAARK